MSQKERWNETKTKSFVSSYLQKPALWDASSTAYSQKTEKLKAYEALMEEFGLTINEVRNKIRIYRTTYMQEKNKEATIKNYSPRLSWYNDMNKSFKEGQVKSFAKKPLQGKSIVKRESIKEQPASPPDMSIQYEYVETEESNDVKAENSSLPTHIIIEPYEEGDEQEEHLELLRESPSNNKKLQSPEAPPQATSLLSSNELFLQSLKSSLDKLPDEKNMRARIKIQEVLYTIMYEKP